MAAARAAQIRVTFANLIRLFPTRSDRLKDEVRLQAGLFCAPHHGTQKDGFEFAAVIGEVTMRLAKDGNNLRHLKTERPVLVGERGSMTLRLMLLRRWSCKLLLATVQLLRRLDGNRRETP